MAYLSSSQITALQTRKTRLEAQIEALQDQLDSAISSATVESYRMDTSEGSMRTDRRDPASLQKHLDIAYRMLDAIDRRLNNTSNVNLNVRRK